MTECDEKLKSDLINNDLQLEGPIFDIPQEILFPSELNKHLKDKIQVLLYENSILKRTISEKEIVINELRESVAQLNGKIDKYESNNDFAPLANVARSKIVELSKKLREKSSELETYRNKCSKLEQEMVVIKQNELEKVEIVAEPKPPVNDNELKQLQDKLNATSAKLFDEKNQNLKLKNDLKVAHKLLQDEIGETFESLQQLSANSNWRGRSQQIQDLQHKNNELKEKLKSFQEKDTNKSENNQRKNFMEKRLDKINKECETYKTEISELKRKLDSYKIKIKNMDVECSVWKNKFTSLTEQMEKDHELITTLTAQNTTNANSHAEILRKKDKAIERTQKELKDIKLEYQKDHCMIENLEKQLSDKEIEIDRMRSSTHIINNADTKIIEERLLQKFQAERIRLVELSEVTMQRLNAEREAKANMENLYRQERHKAARLEAKIARLQLEDGSDKSGSYMSTNRQTQYETLLYKLELAEENIKALKTRLDIEKKERELDMQEFSKIVKNYTTTDEK